MPEEVLVSTGGCGDDIITVTSGAGSVVEAVVEQPATNIAKKRSKKNGNLIFISGPTEYATRGEKYA